MRVVLGSLLLVGCGQEYELSSVQGPMASPGAVPAKEAPQAPTATRRPLTTHTLPPLTASSDDPSTEWQEVHELGGGAQTPVADFLFVVDPSSSMERVIHNVRKGFDALADDGVFPADARIAVMNTTPADPLDPTRVHPGVRKGPAARLDPGFMGLVDAARIDRVRGLSDRWMSEFTLDGCAAWFSPQDTNEQGVPCLEAHTQVMFLPLAVEAGLSSLRLRLETGEPLFRPGAAVNVIFVSDTHDPGVNAKYAYFEDLMLLRPGGQELVELAHHTHDLASFRLHAVAPEVKCSSEHWEDLGPVYLEATLDADGQALDVCSATPADYVAFIRDMATLGSVPQRPVLSAQGGAVSAVQVDGVPVSFSQSPRGALILDVAMPTSRATVEVTYQRARRGGPPTP